MSIPEPPAPKQLSNERAAPTVATKLLRAILAKSFLELLFICVVATCAAFVNYSPLLRGAIDVADQTRVAGWAHDPLAPAESLDVQLFIDGQFIASQRADDPRADLVTAGATEHANHGFRFALQQVPLANGQHTVQVYALRTAGGTNKMLLPLSKKPLVFQVSQ
jgi:hypothetical protein